jgi:NAD(P)-dependent dehydrogenase (short-subunit alcohol dehydrogenase family)
MGWLESTVVMLTGGGSGLGRALVDRFLAEGAQVGVLERSQEKADALAEQLPEVLVVRGDAAHAEANARAVAATVERFGRLDVFVGNVGIWDFNRRFEDTDPAELSAAFDELFAVNVRSSVLGVQAAVPKLRASRGSVVLTLSNAAFHPGGGGVLYTASKHALVGVVRQLAYELAPEVRVNGVAPGGMATDLRGPSSLGLADASFGPMAEGMRSVFEDLVPAGYLPEPADYTGPYVLLASRANSGPATGEVYICDGGIGVRGRREMELIQRLSAPPA